MADIFNTLGTNNSGGIWGSITGNILNQVDLIDYLENNYYPLDTNPSDYLTLADLPPQTLQDIQSVLTEGNTATDLELNFISLSNNTTLQIYNDGVSVYGESGEIALLSSSELNMSSGGYYSIIQGGVVYVSETLSSAYSNLAPGYLELNPDGTNQTFLYPDKIIYNAIDYPYPEGISSRIATLNDITSMIPGLNDVTGVSNYTAQSIELDVLEGALLQFSSGQGNTIGHISNIDGNFIFNDNLNGTQFNINLSGLTLERSYILPDKNGTFAMLDDITGGVTSVNGDTGVVVVDLQSATDEGGEVISTDGLKKVEIDKDNGQIKISTRATTGDAWVLQTQYGQNINTKNTIFDIGDLDGDNLGFKITLDNDEGSLNLFNGSFGIFSVIKNSGIIYTNESTGGVIAITPDKITIGAVDYPLPTGVSSQIATLADITTGISDGNYSDIIVSGTGLIWTIGNNVITDNKIDFGIDVTKLADGSVSNIEFEYINSLTSNAQTQLDYRVITLLNDNITSSVVTGTIANTILKSYFIPANTLSIGDTLDLKTVCSKTGTNANCNFRLYTNTTNNLGGALPLAMVTPTGTNLYFSLDRTYTLKSGNTLESFPVIGTTVTDESPSTLAISNTAFNPAVDNYFIVAIQPNNSSDSFRQTLFYITLMKQRLTI